MSAGIPMRYRIIRDQWFLIGMLAITAAALAGPSGFVESAGQVLARIHASEWGIALIFLCSGLELKWGHVLDALRDWRATGLALFSIFVLAPALAWAVSRASSSEEIRMGFILIGVVPTTLASGMVMANAAGGRAAHALLITLLANLLCILTIPIELAWMIRKEPLAIELPYGKISMMLAGLIALPLLTGMVLQKPLAHPLARMPFRLTVFSRGIILALIFLGLANGRENILGNGNQVILALVLVTTLHLALSGVLWQIMRSLGWGPGRRESVFFMGVQKTLPLSLWLQTTYFGNYGMALVICIFYHIIQLIVGSYVVGRLSRS